MINRVLAALSLLTLSWGGPGWADDLPAGFARLRDVSPNIRQDIRYATTFNFTGEVAPGYERAECILTKQAAEALATVERHLNEQGLALKVYDCYRPATAVDFFVSWVEGKQDSPLKNVFYPHVDRRDLIKLGYIASKSGHSRGSTLDVGLVRLADAKLPTPKQGGECDGPFESRPRESLLDMGTSFDCFSPKSAFAATDVSAEARANRATLRAAMTQYGFNPYEPEWWHFTLNAEPYPDTYFDFPVR
jgi:zinc D-Ala-D-Ala dipeptidase